MRASHSIVRLFSGEQVRILARYPAKFLVRYEDGTEREVPIDSVVVSRPKNTRRDPAAEMGAVLKGGAR